MKLICTLILALFFSLSIYAQEQQSSSVAQKFHPKKVFYEGSITLGHEYGLLPYLINSSPPSNNTKIEGVFGFTIKKLPFKSSFYYSSMSTVTGLNNYFRIQFDVQRYMQDLKDEANKKYAEALSKKDSLNRVKQSIIQKLSFYELIKKYKVYDVDAMKGGVKDSLMSRATTKDSTGGKSNYDDAYGKKDRLYLLKTNKKCIKDSLNYYKKQIKHRYKDNQQKDSTEIDTYTVSKKEELGLLKKNRKVLMDSLKVYKRIIRMEAKNKRKKEKTEKKKQKKNKKEALSNKKDSLNNDGNNIQNKYESLKDSSLIDSTLYNAKKDSLSEKQAEAMSMSNEAREDYKKLTQQLEDVNKQISLLDATIHDNVINEIEERKEKTKGEVKKKKQKAKGQFLRYIKKFEIGSVNPDHSYFLCNNIPVTGVNFEFGKRNFYLAFTHGKTINNIFLTNNLIDNQLNSVRNLYNFFDFNNIEQGRKITSLKLGYGKKETSHFFIGGLYGVGKSSYADPNNNDKEKNYVYELDGRLMVKKNHTLDMIYGRSAIQINGVNYEEQEAVFNQLFGFKDRTNAALIRSISKLFKGKAKLQLTFRYIDPFFITYGVGFLRNDNIRYEVKWKQKISKKIAINASVRREEDNILNIYAFKNLIFSYGLGVSYRITKKTMVKVDYRPIIQEIKTPDTNPNTINENHIVNLIGTHHNRIGNTAINVTGVYSYYKLKSDSTPGIYKNYNVSLTAMHKDKLENSLSFNRFETNDTLSVPDANIFQNELSVYYKKIEITGIAKLSFSSQLENQIGYGLGLKYKLTNYLVWKVRGEKLILNDFYNSLPINNVRDFPYFISSSLSVFW